MPALIAYYSRADENYFGGTLRYIDKGNTQIAAEILQSLTGADMFRIEQLTPYSKDYNSCIEEARSDLRRNARPELKAMPESLDKYDTIYLGFPNYWGTMPMAVYTFLESFDFSEKTIYPFCTHEGSELSSTENDIKKAANGATVSRGIAIRGSSVDGAKNALEKWVNSVAKLLK